MAQVDVAAVLDTPLLRTYFFYGAILVVKMMLMSPLTAVQRFKNKAFANPEDAAGMKVKPRVDENVERVRRAHMNDLENITLFFAIGFIYIQTNPPLAWATLLFRVFTAARFIHTFVYAIWVVPQPARALSWGVGFLVTGYMAFKSIMHFAL